MGAFLVKETVGTEPTSDTIETAMWGLLPAGPFHVGYDYFSAAIRWLEQEGIETTILFPHAQLSTDPWVNDINGVISHYKNIFESHSAISPRIDYGEFQYSAEYIRRLLKLSRRASATRSQRIVPDDEPSLQDLVFALMQILDPRFLGVDLILTGRPQRRVYMFGREILPECQKLPTCYLRLARDIYGRPLAESSRESRITVTDDRRTIREKLHVVADRDPDQLRTLHRLSVAPFVEGDIAVEVDEMTCVLDDRFTEMRRELRGTGGLAWIDDETDME